LSDIARQVDQVDPTPEQRQALYEIVRNNPYVGFKTAARRAGIAGTSSQVRGFLRNDPEFQQVLEEARGVILERVGLGVPKLLENLGEVANEKSPSQLRAIEYALSLHGVQPRQRVEVTGEDGDPVEVNNPDVAAAVDRFTALADAAIRAAARGPAEPAALEP
jgi:hypothetical protein